MPAGFAGFHNGLNSSPTSPSTGLARISRQPPCCTILPRASTIAHGAQALQHLGLVIHDHHREADLAFPRQQGLDQLAHQPAIETRERFVEQNQRRAAGQHAGQRHAAGLAPGDLGSRGVPFVLEAQAAAQAIEPSGFPRRAPRTCRTQAERHISCHREMRKQVGFLREIADGAAVQGQGRRKELEIAQADGAAIRLLDPGDGRKDGALARSGGAEQGQASAGRQAQLDIHGEIAAPLDDARLKHADLRCAIRCSSHGSGRAAARKATSSGMTAVRPKLSRFTQSCTGIPAG